ncbi:hypothetical protein D3C80_1750830 [compost metagenome]
MLQDIQKVSAVVASLRKSVAVVGTTRIEQRIAAVVVASLLPSSSWHSEVCPSPSRLLRSCAS